jgi:ribosomal protein S27AE
MAVAKKCEQCGRVDMRTTWPNEKDAAKDPSFDRWTCPNCAWTEFDLVEVEAEPATR